eukprot:scaffold110628_cov99-Phaeocystis_antarctica.AAC.1
MQDRYAERRGAPGSGPGVRLTGRSGALGAVVGACCGTAQFDPFRRGASGLGAGLWSGAGLAAM